MDRAAPSRFRAKAPAAHACLALEQIPNIGPSLAADLRAIGIERPGQLAGQDAYQLYRALCEHSGQRQDPCVLDTFLAAVDFMRGAEAAPWWHYTAERKRVYGQLGAHAAQRGSRAGPPG
jgi:hypothetical protein